MDIKKALENNEFILYYQPKVDIQKNQITSAEALIRLKKDNKIYPPSFFIPHAEKSGEIVDIDKWVMKKVVNDSREIFVKSHQVINISFNLSGISFKNKNLINNLEKVFKFSKDFNSEFEIEITETALIDDVKRAKKNLEKLKEIGFTLSIDDFGIGYGSLTYLKEFPIDVLKIDKSFIDDMLKDKKVEYIVESLIYLSNKLNLTSIAEGVEDIDQVDLLKKLNCNKIQGYFYSKPLPLEKFLILIDSFNEKDKKTKFIRYTDEKYSVGDYAFDSQHFILVNLLNKLFDVLKDKEKRKFFPLNYFTDILDEFLKFHFDLEEKYMKKHNYPHIHEHLKEHQKFLEVYNKLKNNLTQTNERNLFNLFNLLKEWFLKHEMTEDKKLVNFVKKVRK